MASKIDKESMRVLVIGSGPVVIGQSAEFDYAGTQACRILKERGIYTILLNSNPATIQTDNYNADIVHIEPINVENAKRIIEEERVTHIVGSMGGQTALNLVMDLHKTGYLEEKGVSILGTQPESIRIAEDRELFHTVMEANGIAIPWSVSLKRGNFKEIARTIDYFPVILRTSFSLGGLSGKIIEDGKELISVLEEIFSDKNQESVEIEKSLLGLIEMEYEIIRDHEGNSIMVCNMENIDPMGVHTGESIVVTPSLTIPDNLHQKMRKTALQIAEITGIIGACNVQFALDLDSEIFYVVEINPRTSRSSALASKASGYPIAKVATMIMLGDSLGEISNPITKNTSASFEPSMDYVIVKIPIWPVGKFPDSGSIGVSMKSTGETMGIGRSFEEAFMKAVVSTELDFGPYFKNNNDSEIMNMLRVPNWKRLGFVMSALNREMDPAKLSRITGWQVNILERLGSLFAHLNNCKDGLEPNIKELKKYGFPDRFISWHTGISEYEIFLMRQRSNLFPCFRMIDSSSSEFSSQTKYLYSTYDEEDESGSLKEGSILILGSGSNRIGQGLEFDYSSVKAIHALKKFGSNTLIINSNPETVSTDFNTSDELYFEPLTLEYVSGIIEKRKPYGLIIQFSGQTGQNMAHDIGEIYGEDIILGTKPSSIERIENRTLFSRELDRLGIKQAKWEQVQSVEEISEKSRKFQDRVIIRGSFIIGGSSMFVSRNEEDIDFFISSLKLNNVKFPLLLSEFLEDATEYDLDFISNEKQLSIAGILKQIEPAGIHSGDSIAICGPGIPDQELKNKMMGIAEKFLETYKIVGFTNIQFMEKNGQLYVIELNARASRTIPFISKTSGINWVERGIGMMLGHNGHLNEAYTEEYAAKIPVFPFNRFHESDYVLSAEMRSTGEGMVRAKTLEDLKEKIKSFYSIRSPQYIFFDSDRILDIEGEKIVQITEREAIDIINSSQDTCVICSTESKSRKMASHLADMKKIPLINNQYIWNFINSK